MLYIESTVKSSNTGERTPYGEWTINSTLEVVSFLFYVVTGTTSSYKIPANTPLFVYRLANGQYCVAFKIERFTGSGASNISVKSNGNSVSGSLSTTYQWATYNNNSYYCVNVNSPLGLSSHSPKNDYISVTSSNDMATAFLEAMSYVESYPITYRLTNCTASTAPTEATIGDTVTVPFQFTSGYGFVNPSSDVYVTNNGVVIPSQYSNGVLTFTMPDPS